MGAAPDTAQLALSPRIRKSPYFEATLRYHAVGFSVYNKMYLPMGYDTPENEFWKIVNHVTLWDVGVQRVVEITGPDAFRFTNLLTPRDLTKCRVGQCKYVLLTNGQGGIMNDPVLSRLGENHFWLSRADSDALSWAQGVNEFARMDVSIREPDVSPLQVQGPRSRKLIHDLFGDRASKLRYYHLVETEIDGIPVMVARTGWSAELGFEVYLRDGSRGDELWERIMAAGAPYQISPASPSRIRRIEAGILDYSVDMNQDTNPFEVGLGRLVDTAQAADFLGKQALAQIEADGIKRCVVGLELHCEPLVRSNDNPWPVISDGHSVGELTSCVYSPRLSKNIALAMVPSAVATLGTVLSVLSPSGELPVTVVPRPFHDPNKQLARS